MIRECKDCGLLQRLGEVPLGKSASCVRCGATLRRARDNDASLVCSVVASLLFVAALELPFLDIRAAGRFQEGTLYSGPYELGEMGRGDVGFVVLATLVVVPALKLFLHVTVLAMARTGHPPPSMAPLFRTLLRLRPWAMPEVFILGALVAYTRIRAIAHVDVGPAGIALVAATLAMAAADASLDEDRVWESLGRSAETDRSGVGGSLMGCDGCSLVSESHEGAPCPRCKMALRARKPKSASRAWAFTIAAALLYIPANTLSIMGVIRMGRGGPNTILHGIIELARAHLMPLAIIVFTASILIPVLKLGALFSMLVLTAKGSSALLLLRTRAFRVVATIGRWSMLDMFALATLVAMVRMGFLATVTPDDGAVAFTAVVILTMLATQVFDPRVMWDAAAARART
jgi:paraquat-inducible protein A